MQRPVGDAEHVEALDQLEEIIAVGQEIARSADEAAQMPRPDRLQITV
jgi:hypothetical protein